MKDQKSIDALDVAERYANGLATKEELKAASASAAAASASASAAAASASASASAAAAATSRTKQEEELRRICQEILEREQ